MFFFHKYKKFFFWFIDTIAGRTKPSESYQFRATLSWETDANDLDLHAQLYGNDHVFYSHARDRYSDLRLYQDLTAGLGPEVMTMSRSQGKLRVGARLFAAGAFSVVRGVLTVITFTRDDVAFYPRILPFSANADGQLQVLAELTAEVGTQGYRESGHALCDFDSSCRRSFQYSSP